MSVLPPIDPEDDEQRRLAALLDRCADQILRAVDAACNLRTAPAKARKARGRMLEALEDAALQGLSALAHSQAERNRPTGD